ncbi:hypothetical protein [Pseudomonas fluorescens]|uniref:hypothetical protein n=1 Tax=Pseudomonas fluorescens TaxID=294 RepID=UPI001BE573D2|nr:hypothetical protein [Pseudomonas fluorescens]MBT2370449.1 hypothetical protein [Pseudomonas fluorescens]
MKALSIPMICNRIAVQAPYFAFTTLEGENQTIRGEFIPEQDTGYETGPVAVAELGRHLAILGSCAAVILGTEEKTYYLASKGRLSLFGKPQPRGEGKYHATAQVIAQDKRTLKVHAVASDGVPFAHLDCEYTILSDALFSKTFRNYHSAPVPVPTVSPYTQPIALEYETSHDLTLTARSQPLTPGCFSGHFVEYPTWPVAIIADTVSQVMSRLLHDILGERVHYRVAHFDVQALRLISASDPLIFRVECTVASKLLSRYMFSAQVSRGDVVAATMEMEVYV